jgi:hypothetical protein
MTMDQVEKLTKEMVQSIYNIRKNVIQLTWYMRGGVTYSDAMNMTNEEIKAINEIIDGNMETTKKTKLPFF